MKNYWTESVDFYCERLSGAFWAEPINAISNIFFVIAAFLAFRMWQKSAARSWDFLTLALLMLVVGIGSFVFHTQATRAAVLADIIPIAIFIHFGLGVFLYRVVNAGLLATMLGVFAFALFGFAARKFIPPESLNYSGQYFSAILLLAAMAIYTAAKRVPAAKYFVGALVVFAASLAIRTMDMAVCSALPIGIHYMWHLLNAVVMYLVFKGIISHAKVSLWV